MNYRIAVRALCEFTAKQGDLDLRFTPSPTAQEGIAGHVLIASRRGDGYEKEIPLTGQYLDLQVCGRADGYDPTRNRLEEIKTHRGDLTRQPTNHRHLHWAQAKLYGWLLCQTRKLAEIELALVYFDIVAQRETLLVETHTAEDLRRFFETCCQAFLAWAEQELQHRTERDQALATLRFPYGEFRQGQHQLAEAVYKAACTGTHLLVQAPTGIGKTLATLFPQLKAMPGQRLDKLFFLAAKTSGRQLALDTLYLLDCPALRVLELVARDKACEYPDKACHGDSCPLALGFYDHLPGAREQAARHNLLNQMALRDIALAHRICPYYLSQEMARWADVTVGDYNYYFDQNGLLHGLTQANQWRIGVLVDEAHNLLERARGMYSAGLDQRHFAEIRHTAPEPLKQSLARIQRQWNALNREQKTLYQVDAELPDTLLLALQQAIAAINQYLNEHPLGLGADLQGRYFDALQFGRMAESFGPHSLFDRTLLSEHKSGRTPRSLLCLRNVLPAPFLAPRFTSARSCVLFSATLKPWNFYRDTLGLPPNTIHLEVDSPFQADQLAVHIARRISTRYPDRAASLQPIAQLMAAQYHERPGNYLAFFSSFEYLQQVLAVFTERSPEIAYWTQTRAMQENDRTDFLARFVAGGQGIGFAVLGGAFAEGIDLPGERLIGAFIATLGLPQINPVNEEMRQRMQKIFSAGYDYTYLYPGLQKVIQAAGRVIRTQQDRGVIHLIDDRFAQARIRQLLPAWWRIDKHDKPG
ncbi:ATP-dependent DNA helicase [Azomonas macrocytogenes]|uniref:Rad3-related DNA helicase n=1 Tax=Azomonas macrocytogenes TaxID=69962 RepID=A0A839SXZ9_AZOMA|nr:ATP-dependent DNA helicase [Azomonas macrocytogenes]MBB3102227.1 Rad3-related DNA helicase [Azomonas macrocytogenes]